MGVPKFFRYISERYPCLSEKLKEYQVGKHAIIHSIVKFYCFKIFVHAWSWVIHEKFCIDFYNLKILMNPFVEFYYKYQNLLQN